ncbi:MAG: hypothetical protein HSCHL_1343 [Hydrogenibacillus schlegelii]|uniref:Uncharacterized protein n=1 Tax=Hydrogenibacillus schlegelii TaxID=1484 RepID=A0A2T5G5A0_HYDSH|nr:MAG: hypothetical protein HSCHL_1343 [Hydrogenibacillus schlegelii]
MFESGGNESHEKEGDKTTVLRRRALFVIVPVLFAALLSGCGGAPAVPDRPAEDTTSSAPLSPDEAKRLLAAFPALEPRAGKREIRSIRTRPVR